MVLWRRDTDYVTPYLRKACFRALDRPVVIRAPCGVTIRSDHVVLAQRSELREPKMSTGGRRGAEKSTSPLCVMRSSSPAVPLPISHLCRPGAFRPRRRTLCRSPFRLPCTVLSCERCGPCSATPSARTLLATRWRCWPTGSRFPNATRKVPILVESNENHI